MSDMVLVKEANLAAEMRRQALEAKIGIYMRGAYENMLEVGRCLCEAKDEKLVSHGEWENWVLANTGFSVRQAQRLMQAARAVPSGSIMNGMPISKIQVLLQLPEGDREAVAAASVETDATVRELRAAIEKSKAEGLAADATVRKLKENVELHRSARIELEKEKIVLENSLRSEQRMNARINGMLSDTQARIAELEKQLAENASEDGISEAAQAQIDALNEKVRKLNQFAADQARKRQQAERALLNADMGTARGSELQVTQIGDIVSTIRTFIGSAGVITQMGSAIRTLSDSDRGELKRYIGLVEGWARDARKAMDTEYVDLGEMP